MQLTKKIFGLLLAILCMNFGMISCSSEEELPLKLSPTEAQPSTKVTIDKALEKADAFLAQINTQTRATRRIKSNTK